MWNHWRCSFDCASWGVKQPYDCCLRDTNLAQGQPQVTSGESAAIWRGRIRRCFSVGEASTVRYFGVINGSIGWQSGETIILEARISQVATSWLTFQSSHTGSGAERLTHTSVQSRYLGLTGAVVQHWWCQVHPLATTSPMDYGITCPVLILALMMWEFSTWGLSEGRQTKLGPSSSR